MGYVSRPLSKVEMNAWLVVRTPDEDFGTFMDIDQSVRPGVLCDLLQK